MLDPAHAWDDTCPPGSLIIGYQITFVIGQVKQIRFLCSPTDMSGCGKKHASRVFPLCKFWMPFMTAARQRHAPAHLACCVVPKLTPVLTNFRSGSGCCTWTQG